MAGNHARMIGYHVSAGPTGGPPRVAATAVLQPRFTFTIECPLLSACHKKADSNMLWPPIRSDMPENFYSLQQGCPRLDPEFQTQAARPKARSP